jgi:hypothetical protein
LPSGFEPIQAGHPDVKDENVWLELDGLLDGFAAIAGFSANLPFRLSLQKRDQAFSDYFMVIRDHDSQHTHTHLPQNLFG